MATRFFQTVLIETRGGRGGVCCCRVHIDWKVYTFGEFEEIKGLFVLRSKCEWVQVSYKEKLSMR